MRHLPPFARYVPLALFAACAAGEVSDGPTVALDETSPARPGGFYVPVDPGELSPEEASLGIAGAVQPPRVIFLNRHGGTYTAPTGWGYDDPAANVSLLARNAPGGKATLSGYGGSDASWGKIVDCVKLQFDRFDVAVTDQEPTDGTPYIEAVFGGNGSELGLSSAGGVAPQDGRCGVLPQAVVYVFTQNLWQPGWMCETAAQEVAHAYGLDHEFLETDPMSYLSYDGLQTFQDEDAECGEFSARECSCGRPGQNSVRMLASVLGWKDGASSGAPPVDGGQFADEVPPVVTIVSPAADATLRTGVPVTIEATISDDVAVGQVELYWGNNGALMRCPGPQCEVSDQAYRWTVDAGTGGRRFEVRAWDGAGNLTRVQRFVFLGDPSVVNPAPVVTLTTPADGTTLRAGENLAIAATITDTDGVASARAIWTGGASSTIFPLTPVGSNQWKITLTTPADMTPGVRQLIIEAYDRTGRGASSQTIDVTVTLP